PWRDLPDRDAAAHRAWQGLPARRHRPGGGPAGHGLWPGADRLRAVRADGPVRTLAQDPRLLPALSVLPQRHVQAAEVVPEVRPIEVNAMNDDVLLSAKNLSVRFGGVLAVNNVSFDVKKGEVFTLIGPNGAGKTTV